MGNKVTIDQVAAICGVSKTTISRYLNHKYENISAETRQRIEQVIAELDYRPNRTAQRLKASRSMLIGCCIGDIASPFAGLLLKGITETCESAGYQVLFADSKENSLREQRAIEGFLENRVDGLIVNTTGGNDEFLIRVQNERGVPVVLAYQRIPAQYDGLCRIDAALWLPEDRLLHGAHPECHAAYPAQREFLCGLLRQTGRGGAISV